MSKWKKVVVHLDKKGDDGHMSSLLQAPPSDAALGTTGVDDRMDPAPDDSVLGKVHLLLGAFTPAVTQLGLTELSRRSGVPKATVYRLARQLVDLGYLTKTTTGYQLGWHIFEIGQLVPGPARLCAVARPSLIDLRGATNALLVHLAIARGNDCVYLERIAGRREVGLLSANCVPGLSSASGRVLLAYRDASRDVNGPFGGDGAAERLRSEFETIRTRRWAGEWEEFVPGLKTLAVPIMYADGRRVAAALSVTVPMTRRDDQSILHALWTAATDIDRGLQRPGTTERQGPISFRARDVFAS